METIASGYANLFAKETGVKPLWIRLPQFPLMKYVIKNSDGLYVGSYWKTGCQLQELDHANYFAFENEAETCRRNLTDFCGLKLEIEQIDIV